MVYMETPHEGTTTKDHDTVERTAVTYDVLRNEALSARASRDLMRKAAEERWTP
jgi:hypothetical protein